MWFLFQSKEDIQKFIDKFGQENYDKFVKNKQRLSAKGQSADILYYVKNYDVEQLEKLLYDIENKVVKDSSGKTKNNVIKVAENEYYTVYDVLDWQTSMNMGDDTCWCITGRYQTNGEVKPSQAKQYFNEYKYNGVKFYLFCMPKNSSLQKYCIVVYNKDRYSCWDSQDNNLEQNVPQQIPSIDYKGFKYQQLTLDPNAFNVNKLAENQYYTAYEILDWQTAVNLGEGTYWGLSGRSEGYLSLKQAYRDFNHLINNLNCIVFYIPKHSGYEKYHCIIFLDVKSVHFYDLDDSQIPYIEMPRTFPGFNYDGIQVSPIVIKDASKLNIIKATLLTAEQAKKLPSYLRQYDTSWTKDVLSGSNQYAFSCTLYGFTCADVNDVLAVRPALKFSNLEQSGLKVGDCFEFGKKQFKIISNDTAFCITSIDYSPYVYCDDFTKQQELCYQTSVIKRRVDKWFEKAKQEKQ